MCVNLLLDQIEVYWFACENSIGTFIRVSDLLRHMTLGTRVVTV